MLIPALLDKKYASKTIQLLDINTNSYPDAWDLKDVSASIHWYKLQLSMNRISVVDGLPSGRNPPSKSLAEEIDGSEKHRPWKCAVLDLSVNHLRKISGRELRKLSELRYLNLSSNQITEINGVDNLGSLRVLNLSNNQITQIATGLHGLNNLYELDLSMNKIEVVEGLNELSSLHTLKLNCNRIKLILPLTALHSLRVLELRKNVLREVNNIGLLKHLETLNVCENNITNLSPFVKSVLLMESLLALNAAGNPCEEEEAFKVRMVQNANIQRIDGVFITDAFRHQLINLKKQKELDIVVNATSSEYESRIDVERKKKTEALQIIHEQENRIEQDFNEYKQSIEHEMEDCMTYIHNVAKSSRAMKESWIASEEAVKQWHKKIVTESKRRERQSLEAKNNSIRILRPNTVNPDHEPPEILAQMRPSVYDAKLQHHMRGVKSIDLAFNKPKVWKDIKEKDRALSGDKNIKGKVTYSTSTIGPFLDPDAQFNDNTK